MVHSRHWWWAVVKQVWSELNSRLGHGESIKPSLRQAGGRVCGTLGRCNPEEIFTAGNLHTARRSKNCPGCYEVEIACS